MKSRLRGPNLNPPVDERENVSVGLPTLGLAMDINPHRMVNIFGELSGFSWASTATSSIAISA